MAEDDGRRWATYRLLILVALAIAAGRIAVVTRDGVTAFLSANDRSRWSTVAALVEDGTYVIDRQEQIVVNVRGRRWRPWATIDKVVHAGRDGVRHSYSSKPPLLPTLVAGLYAIVRPLTGMTLTEQPMYMTRILLALVNLPLLWLFLAATLGSIERIARPGDANNRDSRSDHVSAGGDDGGDGDEGDAWWPTLIAVCVCFGTMMLPFTVSLNNHLPAAAATATVMWIYLYAAERRKDSADKEDPSFSRWWWFIAGLAAAFAVANELPALSMLALWGLLFLLLDRRSLLPMSAGIAVIVIGFFGTNWLAHESLRPPYAHRGHGRPIADLPAAETPRELEEEVAGELRKRGLALSEIVASDESGRWIARTSGNRAWFALLPVTGDSPVTGDGIAADATQSNATATTRPRWQLAYWDDWYEYPGTHWKPENLTGVDRGEASRGVYLLHMTIGHHGLFSLTPLWLLVPWGLLLMIRTGRPDTGRPDGGRLAGAIAISSLVCFLFYLARPEIDRNYGGVSACFRWLLWFAPLWLLAISPAVRRLAQSAAGRVLLQAMLAISIFSLATALASPWEHPWIYRFWAFLGWIDAS